MNKTELIAAVSEAAGLTKKDSKAAVEAALAAIGCTLEKGERVALAGFGTFAVKERAERTCRNPKTGEAMTVPASKVVSFKAAGALKDKAN